MFKEASRSATGIDRPLPLVMDKLDWLQGELVKPGT